MMGMWFILLVPFFNVMVELGNQNTSDDEEELEVGSGTYRGEEEEMEGDDDHETDSDDGQKHKETSTPLWNVTKLGGGNGGGTTKFICSHCNNTGSYTRARKHLYWIMPSNESNTIGVETCDQVPMKDKNIYKKEEEAAQN
jgi:hypothetical protein